MEIGKLLDRIDKEENLYHITVNLSQKARQLQDKIKPSDKEIANPVVAVLEKELAARTK
ncbi:MAG: hypothetical protein KAX20_02085 [Candidatus Omnitrophica bacterium]|nr:hypothetical protein [Candidatus Omnitrophota bacterium]